jgi:hypothetical protein
MTTNNRKHRRRATIIVLAVVIVAASAVAGVIGLASAGSARADLPVVVIKPVPTSIGGHLQIRSGLDLLGLQGFAVRAVQGEPDKYFVRVISGPQLIAATSQLPFPLSSGRFPVGVAYTEARLDDYPRFTELMPRRFQLPVFLLDARTGTSTPATDADWHAASPPSTFKGYPTSHSFFDRLSVHGDWSLGNTGVNRRPLPPVPGIAHAGLWISLDLQFGALLLADREGGGGLLGLGDGRRAFTIAFIDMKTGERLDPSFEIGELRSVNAIQVMWTPDNRYLICAEFPSTPDRTYSRLWIIPFEHGRKRPVGPWDHIRYVDHPAYTPIGTGDEVQAHVPRPEEYIKPTIPKEWAEPGSAESR